MAEKKNQKEEGIKVVLLGDAEVGKTTIFTRFKTGRSVDPQQPGRVKTTEDSECTNTVEVDGKKTAITLYDTAGMERYNSTIPPTYFRSARVVLFVYAVDNPESIDNITSWTESVGPQRLEYAGHTGSLLRVLVANKMDLVSGGESEDFVSHDRGKNAAESLDADLFFEISALKGTGFDEFFEALVKVIREKQPDSAREEELQSTVTLGAKSKGGGSKSGCC